MTHRPEGSPPLPRLSQRIALLGSALLVTFILALGGAAWLLIREDQSRAQHQLMDQELDAAAARVGRLLAAVHGELRDVAHSSLLSTALVDSTGREAYLVPYLQGLRRVYGVPVSIVFTDFEGKEIARNGVTGIADEDFRWVQQVLSDRNQPRAVIVGSGETMVLRVAEPIFYSRTQEPEGALLYRIALADLTDGAANLTPAQGSAQPAATAGSRRRVPLPAGLAPIELSLALRQSAVGNLPTADLLALLSGATVVATLLAVWATRRMAAHLTRDLGKLVTFATDVSRDGLEARGNATGDTQDVQQLADALNGMLEQLRRQHRLLQEESEARYRSLVENMPGAAYRCPATDEPELEYVSRGIEALTGFPASDFNVGPRRSYAALIHPEDRSTRRPATGQRFNIWEYRITDAFGQERWIWERNQRRHIAGEPADSLEGVLFDITDRKRTEQSLLQATRAAESASLAKSQFVATMSHELRTPLSGILGMGELLLAQDIDDGERIEHARTILQSGQALLAQLNDILDLSRIEAGRLELRHVPLYPARLAQEVAALFSASAQARHIELRCEPRLPMDAAYVGDPLRLRQMLANFTSNAVKFTDSGHILVSVAERDTEAGSALEFSVSDSGIGIPAERTKELFEPFSQLDASNTRRHGGSGLGLSIVQNLATLMNGCVGAESIEGEGSRFWFRIPAHRQASNTRSPEATPAESLQTIPAEGIDVLLADDNPMIRRVIESMLKHAGIRCTAVATGAEALTLATGDSPPDLLLMDCQMPGMDGFETTAAIRDWELRHDHRRVPVIALTAAAFEQDRERCLAAGMDDFLAKPVSLRDLVGTVLAHAGGRKAP
ncbi:MAG: hypothetical protein RLZZ393_1035 [Pseudomonadota bacterium]